MIRKRLKNMRPVCWHCVKNCRASWKLSCAFILKTAYNGGLKGLINDPHMDNSYDINEGLRLARELLVEINDSGLPAAGEF